MSNNDKLQSTPRTDAAVIAEGNVAGGVVTAEFARQLESELALAERRLATSEELRTGLAKALQSATTALAALTRIRDEDLTANEQQRIAEEALHQYVGEKR